MENTLPIPPIIGIRGIMGSGKDTVAALIREHWPEYAVWKYADALREAVYILTDLGSSSQEEKEVSLQLYVFFAEDYLGRIVEATRHVMMCADGVAPENEVWRVAPLIFRELIGYEYHHPSNTVAFHGTIGALLQRLGTQGFRQHLGEDVWVRALVRRWEHAGRPPVIVADVRFPNESAMIRRANGVVVLVKPAGFYRRFNNNDGRLPTHLSEYALEGEEPDVVVENPGSPGLRKFFEKAQPWIWRISAERQRLALQ
jgi:hypothetical protein